MVKKFMVFMVGKGTTKYLLTKVSTVASLPEGY